MTQTTIYADYREVDGRLYPFEMTIIAGPQTISAKVESVEVNTGVEDSVFRVLSGLPLKSSPLKGGPPVEPARPGYCEIDALARSFALRIRFFCRIVRCVNEVDSRHRMPVNP